MGRWDFQAICISKCLWLVGSQLVYWKLQHWLDLFAHIICSIRLLLVCFIGLNSIERLWKLCMTTFCDCSKCLPVGLPELWDRVRIACLREGLLQLTAENWCFCRWVFVVGKECELSCSLRFWSSTIQEDRLRRCESWKDWRVYLQKRWRLRGCERWGCRWWGRRVFWAFSYSKLVRERNLVLGSDVQDALHSRVAAILQGRRPYAFWWVQRWWACFCSFLNLYLNSLFSYLIIL